MSAVSSWGQPLRAALNDYASDHCPAGDLAALFRGTTRNQTALPDRYLRVLEQLLEPLEASALFSEESCAFSRTDLAASLAEWLTAAESVAP